MILILGDLNIPEMQAKIKSDDIQGEWMSLQNFTTLSARFATSQLLQSAACAKQGYGGGQGLYNCRVLLAAEKYNHYHSIEAQLTGLVVVNIPHTFMWGKPGG